MSVKRIAPAFEISDLWQTCLSFEYDRPRLVNGIAAWLARIPHERILDCACGTGFPALDLIAKGFSVTCSDGSLRMLREFEINAAAAGLLVTPHLVLWEGLGALFNESFDVVMCRGCSLVFAGGWDECIEPDPSRIALALQNFAACTRSLGFVYVDTTSAADLNLIEEQEHYPTRQINGRTVSLFQTVRTDRVRRIRTWSCRIEIDGKTFDFKRHSYYLPHDELATMMEAAGLTDVRQVKIEGERYAVFVGRKSMRELD